MVNGATTRYNSSIPPPYKSTKKLKCAGSEDSSIKPTTLGFQNNHGGEVVDPITRLPVLSQEEMMEQEAAIQNANLIKQKNDIVFGKNKTYFGGSSNTNKGSPNTNTPRMNPATMSMEIYDTIEQMA